MPPATSVKRTTTNDGSRRRTLTVIASFIDLNHVSNSRLRRKRYSPFARNAILVELDVFQLKAHPGAIGRKKDLKARRHLRPLSLGQVGNFYGAVRAQVRPQ